jgi:hypothetical protein
VSRAVWPKETAVINVDLVSATSISVGVSGRFVMHRERTTKLPECEIRYVESHHYAKAAWFVYFTNFPAPEPAESVQLPSEVGELRGKMVMWATPLIGAGMFDKGTIVRIKEGGGNKDAAAISSRWSACTARNGMR